MTTENVNYIRRIFRGTNEQQRKVGALPAQHIRANSQDVARESMDVSCINVQLI